MGEVSGAGGNVTGSGASGRMAVEEFMLPDGRKIRVSADEKNKGSDDEGRTFPVEPCS